MKNKQVGLAEDPVRSTRAWVPVDLFFFFYTLPPLALEKIFSELQFSCLLNYNNN